MNKKQLIEYCEARGIPVLPEATVEYLNAAIVRSSLHLKAVDGSCFGFWEFENNTCGTCDFEGRCFKAGMGVNKDAYFKKLESLKNPRFRLAKKKLTKS